MSLRSIGLFFLAKSCIVSTHTHITCYIAYKHKGDVKHKDMQSLVGVHIKNELDEILDP